MQATNTPLGISGLLVSSLLNENDDSESSNDTDDDNRYHTSLPPLPNLLRTSPSPT